MAPPGVLGLIPVNIQDFAAALRQMADNADRVAEYHDVAEMDQLRVAVADQAAKAERDADLIAELRRQVISMGRSLDAIGRLRLSVLDGDRSAVQILADALLVISGPCRNFAGTASCRDEGSGRTRGGEYGATCWCDPCIARDALKRADPALELEAK